MSQTQSRNSSGPPQSRNSSGPPRRRYQKPEEVWIPKTSIGKRVIAGEINSMEEILSVVRRLTLMSSNSAYIETTKRLTFEIIVRMILNRG